MGDGDSLHSWGGPLARPQEPGLGVHVTSATQEIRGRAMSEPSHWRTQPVEPGPPPQSWESPSVLGGHLLTPEGHLPSPGGHLLSPGDHLLTPGGSPPHPWGVTPSVLGGSPPQSWGHLLTPGGHLLTPERVTSSALGVTSSVLGATRSEERRVGKEC